MVRRFRRITLKATGWKVPGCGTESLEPLGLLHVAVTPGTLVCQALKHIQRLLAIDITQVGPRSVWCTGNESQAELAEHFLVRCPPFRARRASSLLPLFYFSGSS